MNGKILDRIEEVIGTSGEKAPDIHVLSPWATNNTPTATWALAGAVPTVQELVAALMAAGYGDEVSRAAAPDIIADGIARYARLTGRSYPGR